MRSIPSWFSSQSRRMVFGFSPWLIVGVSSVLALAITVMAVRNTERERLHLTRNYVDRADALIWALEAGARTGVKDPDLLQLLIRETVRQPGIFYMAVVDARGNILAHSDPAMVGKSVPEVSLPPGEPPRNAVWRSNTMGRRKMFEVYREFAPVRAWPDLLLGRGDSKGVQRPTNTFAFVGFDQNPFEEALENDYWLNLLSAFIIVSIGLGGYISLFWAYNYRRSRRMLRDTQALASQVVSNLPAGLITCDPSGHIGMCNDVALQLLHMDRQAILNTPLRDLPGLDWSGIVAALKRGESFLGREMELFVNDSVTSVSLSASRIRSSDGNYLGHLFIFSDTSEVKRLQKELRHSERLSALGNLAAGVAHEVRNPLSSIKGLATYIANKMTAGGREEEAARTMIGEVNRLDRVVSQLLDFSRPVTMRLADQDIHETIRHALRLAETDLRSKKISVSLSGNTDFPPVRINAERVTQALLNLFLNAVQSMDVCGKLDIAVTMSPDGEHFRIAVSDDGNGMSEEVQTSIFLPYFTTKPSGTGLGLAIVHQIMEGHGGFVRVTSEPGAGSTFTLVFPLRPAGQE